jgi:hypothetical protein
MVLSLLVALRVRRLKHAAHLFDCAWQAAPRQQVL